MSHPMLDVVGYEIEELTITPYENFDSERDASPAIALQFNILVEERKAFGVRLGVTVANDEDDASKSNAPYSIRTTIRGWFETPLELKKRLPAPLANNALNVLYGTLRGFLAQTTGLFVNGPFMLPAVVLDSLVERASQNPSSGVIPYDLQQVPPGAEYAFGFMLAIRDLPVAIAVVQDDDIREELLQRAQFLKERVSKTQPTEENLGEMFSVLGEIDEYAKRVGPLSALIQTYAGRVRVGLDRAAARLAANADAATATDDEPISSASSREAAAES